MHQHGVIPAVQQDQQRSGDDLGVSGDEGLLDGGEMEVVERNVVGLAPGGVFGEIS